MQLEPRFLEPEGWRWGTFEREGRTLRFGHISPQNKPDAIVICLPGLSEFGEKYFEVARNCLDMNLAFWVIDWMGQGAAGRYLKNPLKRHANDFAEDVKDLEHLLKTHITPAHGSAPYVMLAHSMGGNIGLRYLTQNPGFFKCAAFSAPMLGIYALRHWPRTLASLASTALNILMGQSFTSPDGRFSERQNQNFVGNPLTSDLARFALTSGWMKTNPALKIGDVTYGWVYRALRSCNWLTPDRLKPIQTPCMIAIAGEETIVDNAKTKAAANILPNAKLIELPGARHEILMESDTYRDDFFTAFSVLLKENAL